MLTTLRAVYCLMVILYSWLTRVMIIAKTVIRIRLVIREIMKTKEVVTTEIVKEIIISQI